ncbi:MAG: TerB family tellurite resistance protein [Nitrospinae bacterium]|nr:TerB family tellurite resistance protein [Nitrospinota bacterium]
MFGFIDRFFGKPAEGAAKAGGHDVRVAACAILIEMAGMDGEFSNEERNHILKHLEDTHALTPQEAEELLQTAARELKGAIDLWHFTNLVNQNYTKEEKLQVIEIMWQVVYADGRLDAHEDYLAHKLGNLLRISHGELMDIKMKVKNVSKPA